MSQDLVPIEFERGPYGEILPPPLVAGMTPQEILETWARDVGVAVEEIPDEIVGEMENLSLVCVHEERLRRAIAGEMMDDPDARDLYRAVTLEGEPMSLCPLGQEGLTFSTFVAPVLRRVGEDRWRIGVEGQGRMLEIAVAPGEALRRAREIYWAWCEAEKEAITAQVQAGEPDADVGPN
jgi:hypothetical protein